MDTLINFVEGVKMLGETAEGWRIGGRAVVFDSHDVSALRDKFTKATDYDIEDGDRRSLYFHHGLDDTIKAEKLGTVTLSVKDDGIWYEGVLKKRSDYLKAHAERIADGIKRGVFGTSTGAPAHLVRRVACDGGHEIKKWVIAEVSITPTPAEPLTSCMSLKSLIEAGEETKKFDPRQPRDDYGKWTDAVGRLSAGHAVAVMKHEGITDESKHAEVRAAIESGKHKTREDVLKHIDSIHAAKKSGGSMHPTVRAAYEKSDTLFVDKKTFGGMKPEDAPKIKTFLAHHGLPSDYIVWQPPTEKRSGQWGYNEKYVSEDFKKLEKAHRDDVSINMSGYSRETARELSIAGRKMEDAAREGGGGPKFTVPAYKPGSGSEALDATSAHIRAMTHGEYFKPTPTTTPTTGAADKPAALSEPDRIADKAVAHVMGQLAKTRPGSGTIFATAPEGFREKYSNLETEDKQRVVKNLAQRGVIPAPMARQKYVSPYELETALEKGAARLASEHQLNSKDRYTAFSDTPVYQRAVTHPQSKGSRKLDDDVTDLPDEYKSVSLTPTEAMQAAARNGIERHQNGESGDGLEPATVERARKIAAGDELTPDHVKRMHSFFSRHAGNRQEPGTPWYTAWQLWGGDAGQTWAANKAESLMSDETKSLEILEAGQATGSRFGEHTTRLHDAVGEYGARFSDWAENAPAIKAGRAISQANHAMLSELHAQVAQLHGALGDFLEVHKPAESEGTTEGGTAEEDGGEDEAKKAIALEMVRFEAQHARSLGVAIEI